MGTNVEQRAPVIAVVRGIGVLVVAVSLLADWLGVGPGWPGIGRMQLLGAVLGVIVVAKSRTIGRYLERWGTSAVSAVRSWWSRDRESVKPALLFLVGGVGAYVIVLSLMVLVSGLFASEIPAGWRCDEVSSDGTYFCLVPAGPACGFTQVVYNPDSGDPPSHNAVCYGGGL